ncbi:MAG: DNA glycosylase [Bacillota bacterium]|nr:DNA glycosylase [Bacillota bacterium]
MTVEHIDDKTILISADFSLKHTFECGQAFRWLPHEGGYLGAARGRTLFLIEREGQIEMSPCTREDYESVWKDYFGLSRDYGKIREALAFDTHVMAGMEYARGLRILNQEPFETLISFIISANNNVKRIQGIIEKMCIRFGERIPGWQELYTFPKPEALACATVPELEACGAGYRAPYVIGTARVVYDGFDLEALRCMAYAKAKKLLMGLPGVGPKVADCVLLFSLSHGSAFPIDVWVARIMKALYLNEGVKKREMENFARERFGEHAGIAQQWLFHYARGGGLGIGRRGRQSEPS